MVSGVGGSGDVPRGGPKGPSLSSTDKKSSAVAVRSLSSPPAAASASVAAPEKAREAMIAGIRGLLTSGKTHEDFT